MKRNTLVKRSKIAVIRPGFHTLDHDFCRYLVKAGFNVTLLIPDTCETQVRIFDSSYYVKRLKDLSFGKLSGYPLCFGLLQYLRKNNFDIVQPGEDFQFNTWLAALYAKLYQKKLFLIEEKYFYSRYALFGWIIRFFDQIRITSFVWNCAQRIISHGVATQNFLIQRGCPKDKIINLFTGVDCSLFPVKTTYQRSNKVIRLITVARHIPHKGIDILLAALADLPSNFHLTIIGIGPLKQKHQDLTNSLRLHDRVLFIDHIFHETLYKQLHKNDIYICASVQENASATIAEAMNCGLPIIVTDTGSSKDFIQDGVNGYIFRSGDIHDLYEKIQRMANLSKIESFGKRNAKFARENLDWKILIKKYANVISG
jgi:glycosyltransferase involved in cell wall biosynthesis